MSTRQVVLDTETTGLDPALGHRIVEVAGVEVVNRRVTDRKFHAYLNPERSSDPGALQVHGLTDELLRDKPKFRDVAGDLLAFLAGAELVIHNAPFDVGFLNAELGRVDLGRLETRVAGVTDSLRLAKDLHPGRRNTLDALCERYAVDNSSRTLHGALLDARLLAEVYLAMTRGQEALVIDVAAPARAEEVVVETVTPADLLIVAATPEERAAHDAYLDGLSKATKGICLWKELEPVEASGGSS